MFIELLEVISGGLEVSTVCLEVMNGGLEVSTEC